MLAVHLIKTYCLPMLCCEIWGARPVDMRSVDVSWNNAFRKMFNACWGESSTVPVYPSLSLYINVEFLFG